MKIIAISDLHGNLPILEPCDVVCICGDLLPLSIQANFYKSQEWILSTFADWLDSLKCDKVLLIAGNHDFLFEDCSTVIDVLFPKLEYLEDCELVYKGIKFYGTPWCEKPERWAFVSKNVEFYYEEIPEDVDVLLTHAAPNIEKIGTSNIGETNECNYGCNKLAKAITDKQPKIVFCGHIHSGQHGGIVHGDSVIYNVSLSNEEYEPAYEETIVEINDKNK